MRVHHEIEDMSLAELRQSWRTQLGEAPPPFRSRDLLARALLYRLECRRHGGPKPALKRRLTDLAGQFSADPNFDPAPRVVPAIGSALVREWNNQRHVVLVSGDGFHYLDQVYSSLTQVAKAITGKHQSGPKFFGLVGDRLEQASERR